jgi:hypothetical protein
MNIMIKYLGFTEDNFKKNIVPELSKLQAA